eukprot:1136919-Prorocentrum_lima.AAC.1
MTLPPSALSFSSAPLLPGRRCSGLGVASAMLPSTTKRDLLSCRLSLSRACFMELSPGLSWSWTFSRLSTLLFFWPCVVFDLA